MTGPVFDEAERRRLGESYPLQPVPLAHGLSGHPLFTLEALAALARRMEPKDILSNMAKVPVEVDPEGIHKISPDAVAVLGAIGETCSWMAFRHVQSNPEYGALLDGIVKELEPVVAPLTGEMLAMKAFIFVSSPGAVTPFHFDPEYNILMQLSGSKMMNVFPAYDERLVSEDAHESVHTKGHVNVPWREEMAEQGRAFALAPGDAVFVPFKSPHWVRNGPAISISLSITWQSEWSFAEADARMMNIVLRRWGRNPRPLRPYPSRNLAKSLAWRAIRRTGLVSPQA